MGREKMGFFRTIAFIFLFIPFLMIDLFHIVNETTEYERRCQRLPDDTGRKC